MAIKTSFNYSPNFNPLKRRKKQIKFIIIHYTGMKKESDATYRLTSENSEVSSHYLIKNNGDLMSLVPDFYIAWHAGKSSWRRFNSLNRYSIGIEISNPGHQFNYKKFSKKQIISLIRLIKNLKEKYKISPKNILGHSDIAPDRKKDPGEKFPWEFLGKNKISLWHDIKKKRLKKVRKIKVEKKQQILFLKNLCKIGYQKTMIKKNDKYKTFVIKAFQRRFRQELVNGKIDEECLIISKNLVK
jgi:N-acetylmuramoyl-L-alanine amidase